MSVITEPWPKHPLFVGLSARHVDLLARTLAEESFEPRELIFHEGDDADKFYLLTTGNVAVEIFMHDRGPVTIQTVGPGEVLGWSWLVEPYRWHFDAQATTTTNALVFDARVVRENFERYPEFGFAMMKRFLPVVVQRLAGTTLQLLDVYHAHG